MNLDEEVERRRWKSFEHETAAKAKRAEVRGTFPLPISVAVEGNKGLSLFPPSCRGALSRLFPCCSWHSSSPEPEGGVNGSNHQTATAPTAPLHQCRHPDLKWALTNCIIYPMPQPHQVLSHEGANRADIRSYRSNESLQYMIFSGTCGQLFKMNSWRLLLSLAKAALIKLMIHCYPTQDS